LGWSAVAQADSGWKRDHRYDQTGAVQGAVDLGEFQHRKGYDAQVRPKRGGADKGKWIAFNKVEDPTGVPSQILGSIEAPGQVYVINRNGIIFGGSSQVNTRGFVASTLPINDNLVGQGLLNNPDAQFLFSALPVPGGSDGTPAFNPIISDLPFEVAVGSQTYTLQQEVAVNATNVPLRAPEFSFRAADGSTTRLVAGTDYTLTVDATTKQATATFNATGLAKIGEARVSVSYTPKAVNAGDVIVQPGARLASLAGGDGNGGRVMLVGANVKNQGTISTTAGQAILAAGQQVAVAAHASDDPSLRGLDVWIGAAKSGTGTVTNSGLIKASTGSISMSGREVNQLGVLDSSTSVNLNGRIDLNASYGAIGNPNFDTGSAKPAFMFQNTGLVTLGEGSVTRILPDYASDRTVPGTSLSEKSLIKVTGKSIHFAEASTMWAPNADVTIRAGLWPYKDTDGNGTTLNAAGQDEPGLSTFYSGTEQRFLFSGGQIYFDPSSYLNVAGSTDVFVPLVQSILDVELRGSELADAPLQRDGLLRAAPLTIDVRQTGVTPDGRYWIGTALGDATGLAGLIQRNIAQLTADGGNVTLQAGGSIVVRDGATIDVSGGTYRYEAGMVETTRLMQFGRLVEISDARPDQVYEGIFTGQFAKTSARWGVMEAFEVPWMLGEHWEQSTIGGAKGGALTLAAPSMAIDGELLGMTVEGPRQRTTGVDLSRLSFEFKAEQARTASAPDLKVIQFSPTPPKVILAENGAEVAPVAFSFTEDGLAQLPDSRVETFNVSPNLLTTQGFGHLSVGNVDGDVVVPRGVEVAALPRGSVSLSGSNVTIRGSVSAPGGNLTFRTFNLSPSFVEEFLLELSATQPDPLPNANRGRFTLAPGAILDTSGLIIDDRPSARSPLSETLALDGGTISISTYHANLAARSTIEVSGGVLVGADGRVGYGDGGSIEIKTGKDLSLGSVTGGTIYLGSTLRGYSGAEGGSLSIQAQLIQIGGTAEFSNTLLLSPAFFQRGGFSAYSLTGIGADSSELTDPGAPETYAPAIRVAPGTVIHPIAESLLALPHESGAQEVVLTKVLKAVGERTPASISLAALGSDDDFTIDVLEARGDIVISAGSRIKTDPGASISLDGQTVTVHGSLIAPGGSISIKGADAFPLPRAIAASAALPTVHIGSQAVISAAGTVVSLPDEFGRRIGNLYDGGIISVFGNIVAERGSVMNASGASAEFDVHPSQLGVAADQVVSLASGITEPLWKLESVPVRLDSDGGLIELEGAQMLMSDATLIGRAGGPTALGGALSIFSGRFYPRANGVFTGDIKNTDINLVVTQSGNVLPSASILGIGRQIVDATGAGVPGMGYFAIDRFTRGGFDSLDLGAKFLESSPTSSLAFGGNIQFKGAVTINVPGMLRVAGGGVIQADSKVALNASYVVIGQPFRPPLNPDDPIVVFQQDPVNAGVSDFGFAPTFGTGNLAINSQLIDVGNVSLQNIGRAAFNSGGDIRGNGTVAIRGDLTLRASQIYPTTLATLNFFAYDPAGGTGSVTIRGGGTAGTPLSAGGSLNVFATNITQGGLLRAPLGTINLGWDGTDFDPSDADLDSPFDPLTRGSIAAPVASEVTLNRGSMTSVSAIDFATGTGIVLPFGLSPDGFTWIDPRGENVTTSGLPEKNVSIAGVNVTTQAGSKVDLRGGGDLYGFRWVPGLGGSRDLLGSAGGEWTTSSAYSAGDLVTFRGATYAARVDSLGQRPKEGVYWSRVEESYAVIPGFTANFAPYNAFNTTNANLLQGEPGYVFSPSVTGDRIFSTLDQVTRTYDRVAVGNQITLSATPGLEAGTYTLLPRRYALYPGAYLVAARSGAPVGSVVLPSGASYTQGQQFNAFNRRMRRPLSIPASKWHLRRSCAAVRPTRITLATDSFPKQPGGSRLSNRRACRWTRATSASLAMPACRSRAAC
jgi:filamentous hemagglutinin family protein